MRFVSIALLIVTGHMAWAQQWEPATYEIGTPVWQDIWVNPVQGNNAFSGATSNLAVRTVTEAWSRIPQGVPLTGHGYRLRLVPGLHTNVPNYWEERYGTSNFPIRISRIISIRSIAPMSECM